MRYRGGGSGSAPSPVCSEDEATRETIARSGTHFSPSRVTSPAAMFMKTADDKAPEEQVVHNVIPLKDKMPPLRFSDVHRKAKSSLTATFVRCQSGASRCRRVLCLWGFFFKTAGLKKHPRLQTPLVALIRLGLTIISEI